MVLSLNFAAMQTSKPIVFVLMPILVLLPMLFPTSVHKEQGQALEDTVFMTLLFAGDVMGHDGQIKGALTAKGSYDYDTCFFYINNIVEQADWAIANLEVTLAGAPYAGYPQFSSPDALAQSLKSAGFDVLATANNHTCDKGKKGILRTLDVLDSIKIAHLGSYYDTLQADTTHPLIIQKNGIRIALFNYTYGTNGIEVPRPTQVNLMDTAALRHDLQKPLKQPVDLKIVFFHWGNEYQTYASNYQKDHEKWAYAFGADMVIGSHPHVVQPATLSNDSLAPRLTVYSLGNFISDQRTHPRDGGMMVKITLAKYQGRTWVYNAGYYLTWVYTPYANGVKKHLILPLSKFEHDTAFFSNPADFRKMLRYANTARVVLRKDAEAIGEYLWQTETSVWGIRHTAAPEPDTSKIE
jgi:poly-gamma-glutamate synthesis protein (capsule biosynthesis protein)